MKKLLFVSTPSSVFHEPLMAAFRKIGFAVNTVDYRGNWVLEIGHPVHRLVGRLPGAFADGIRAAAQRCVDRHILRAAQEHRPDYIFISKAKEIAPEVLDALRAIAVTMNYYPETMDHWDSIRTIAPHYDYFLNYDPHIIALLRAEGYRNALYVPFSVEIAPDERWSQPPAYRYDVSFVGSFHPVRYAEREAILSQIKDLGLHIWGNRAWLGTSLKDYYHGRPSMDEMFEIYRNSRIVINVDLLSSYAGTGVNLRPFEIARSGALLMNHADRKDIFNLFKDGIEFVSFGGAHDVREKVLYYLGHEEERAAIARAGFDRVRDSHSYVTRMNNVFSAISRT